MPNHPNRNWRKRRRVDLAAASAIHEPTGLCVVFFPDINEAGTYDGKPVSIPPAILERAQQDGGKEAARLMREAGTIFKEALDAARRS